MKLFAILTIFVVTYGFLDISNVVSAQSPSGGVRSRLELIDASNPAATFKVRLQTAKGQTTFGVGETAGLELQSDIDAFVIVLTRDAAGSIVQLWPNEWSPKATLKKGVATLLPSGPDAGYKIQAQPPTGLTLIKVIASRQPLSVDGVGTRGFPEVPEGTRGLGLVGDPAKKPQRPSDLPPNEWATAELLLIVTTNGVTTGPVPTPPPERLKPIRPDRSANGRHWLKWQQIGRDLRAGKLDASEGTEVAEIMPQAAPGKEMDPPTEIVVVRRDGARGAAGGYRREVVPVSAPGARGFDRGDLLAQIEKILKEPDVITAYPNYKVKLEQAESSVRLWNLHYHLTNAYAPGVDIGWTKLAPEARRVRPPLIGVVDEGPDIRDPRLAACFAKNTREIPGNFIDDDNNGYVDDAVGWHFVTHSSQFPAPAVDSNHGSFVSSIIAGRPVGLVRDVQGILPLGQIVPAGVFAGNVSGGTLQIINAIRYCKERGARVINLSLSINGLLGQSLTAEGFSRLAADPVWEEFERAGVVLVCAAGNDGSDNDVVPHFPSGLSRFRSNVISVMATDVGGDRAQSLNGKGEWSYFSNYGAQGVTLAAPGTFVVGVPEPNKIGVNCGTSFAAPQVTAAVALLMGMHPEWDYRTVIRALVQTSTPLEALSGRCVSGGIINLPAAVAYNP